MSKAILYSGNSTSQSVALNGVINFGNIIRKYGQNINMSGGNVTLQGAGYYDIDSNFTATAGGNGALTISLYKDGIAIPNATATQTVASGSQYSFSIPAVVREMCCGQSVITAVVTGVTATVSNSSIVVEKL